MSTCIRQSSKSETPKQNEHSSLKREKNIVDDAFTSLFGDNHNQSSVTPNKITVKNSVAKKKFIKVSTKRKLNIVDEILGGTWSGIHSEEINPNSQFIGSTLKGKIKTSGNNKKHIDTLIIKNKKKFATDLKSTNEIVRKKKKHSSMITGTDKKKKSGIDYILSKIYGPNTVNTITKTSHDWDQFKERNSLGEKLKQNSEGKCSYLLKRDFLERVDLRRYELEKENRINKRLTPNNK